MKRRFLFAFASSLVLLLSLSSLAAAGSDHSARTLHGLRFLREDVTSDFGTTSDAPVPSWMALAALPTPLEGHCSARIGDKIFTAYGFSSLSGDTNGLRIYDIPSNTWSLGPAAPLPVRSEGYRGVATGGKLYCIGGRANGPGGPPLNTLESFDPSTSTWTTLASMPDARAGTTAAVQGGSIFVFGGRKGGTPCAVPTVTTDTILRYDIDTNTWSTAGNLAVARSDATAASVGGLVYIFGGCEGSPTTFLSSVEVYNPRTQAATLLSVTMPGGARANAAAATFGNVIHITGGWREPLGVINVTPNHLVFDPVASSFATGVEMPRHCSTFTPARDRAEHELIAHGDRLYAVGGSCPAFGNSLDNLDVLKLT